MKTVFVFMAASALVVLSACSSPGRRIAENEAAFDTYPSAVQSKIRAGEVDIGFTQEQVRMALGKPDGTSTRTTVAGMSEVWIYRKGGGPSLGFGFGMGSGGGSTSVGTGVGVSTGGRGGDDSTRVIFEAGRVSAIERAER